MLRFLRVNIALNWSVNHEISVKCTVIFSGHVHGVNIDTHRTDVTQIAANYATADAQDTVDAGTAGATKRACLRVS